MTFEEWLEQEGLIEIGPGNKEQNVARRAWNAAMKVEREECAKACEDHPDGLNMLGGAFVACAAAIRMRSSCRNARYPHDENNECPICRNVTANEQGQPGRG